MSGPVDMSPEQLADFVHLLRYHEASARRRCLEFMAASFGMAADYVERHPPPPETVLQIDFAAARAEVERVCIGLGRAVFLALAAADRIEPDTAEEATPERRPRLRIAVQVLPPP